VEGGANVISSEETRASLNLSWDIYQGGAVTAQTRTERTKAAQAQLSLDNRRQEVRVRTVQTFYDWESALQEVRSLRAQVRSTKTQLEAIETGFEVGRRTSVDVLDAQQEYFDALRSLAQARHQYLLARIQLRAAAGTLDRDALARVNGQLDGATGGS
jgi:outer membrane protein